jgi:4-oxalocrotonate tautomerase
MPLIQVNLASGRPLEQLHALQLEIHEAVKRALPDAADPSIRVLLYELPASHWLAGGITLAEKERAAKAAP